MEMLRLPSLAGGLTTHTNNVLHAAALGALTVSCMGVAQTSVVLPKVLGDHMVIQRDRPIHIWGWAAQGEDIVVKLDRAQSATRADQAGNWAVDLPPMKAGGPFQMTVKGTSQIQVDDILIGDLWIASGQSNMEMPLGGTPDAKVNNAEQEIQAASHPEIRLLHVERAASTYPMADLHQKRGWTVCSPETVRNFSAVAYFFGRGIAASEKVPIGLIDSSWGGTPAEAWISLSGLTSNAALISAFDEFNNLAAIHGQDVLRWDRENAEDDQAKSLGQPAPARTRSYAFDGAGPGTLFNGMISPLLPLRVRGVIWYQGEQNTTPLRAPIYERLFPAMIQDWRKKWKQEDMPFLFVQLANWSAHTGQRWPIVREAQRHALSLANTAMAVTIDVGDSNTVHPGDKQSVGHRLALAARAVAYREPIEFSGPLFAETSLEPRALRVWFHHADGMHTAVTDVPGFELAGDDQVFLPATEARIEGESILLSNPAIAKPIYVRYGWEDDPKLNLYNADNLPASPFSTVDRLKLR
jgi:sialate O-acetylesterase